MKNGQREKILKIIILGSSDVGKTCIFNRYFNNEFKENLLSTIGIDFQTKFFKFDEQKVKCNFTDTAGQEKFKAVSVNYLKGTDGVILVFDITNKVSYDQVHMWIEEIKNNVKVNIGKILIGNKSDLENEREVSIEEGKSLAMEIGCKYYEASAKTGENINEALDEIAKISYQISKDDLLEDERDSIRLPKENIVKKKKKCC